jgi:hypothetical protein
MIRKPFTAEDLANTISSEPPSTSFVDRSVGVQLEEGVMKLRISALATAALVAVSVPTLSGTAEARGFGMHGGFGHAGFGHAGFGHVGGWGGHHGGWGWGGVGLGLATGALVGAALAAPYYGYGYPYAYDYYDYGYPVAYDYGYAPAAYTVGYVGPYWGGYRRPFVRHHYAHHVGYGGYGGRIAYGGYRGYGGRVAYGGYSHAAFRSYGAVRAVHHGRFR